MTAVSKKRISSIKTMWRNLRDHVGLDTAVNPYLRRTIAKALMS